MPFKHLIICCLAAYLPLNMAIAAPISQLEIRHVCSQQFFSQSDVKTCIENAFTQSVKELEQAEQHMDNALKTWDEDPPYIRQARSYLVATQKEFIQYRDIQCKLLSATRGGAIGHVYDIMRLSCIAELNQRRAIQIREVTQELQSQ